MIKELQLKDWKSFESSVLYIDPLTVLIGTNASGKSNILDAFQLLFRLSWGKQIISSVNGDADLSPLRGGIDWISRVGTDEFEFTLLVGDNENEELDFKYSLRLKKSNGSKLELVYESLSSILARKRRGEIIKKLFYTQEEVSQNPGISAYFSTDTKGRGKRIDLSRSHTILSQIETITTRSEVKEAGIKVMNELRNIFILDPIPNHMRNYTKLSETLLSDGSNIAGILAALPEEKKEHLENDLTKFANLLPEKDIIKVWADTVGKLNTDAMLYCKEGFGEKGNIEIDARGMSDGTLRFLAIITAILTVKKGSLLIIEEIDNGLHPSRARELVNMLHDLGKTNSVDILCTTHNPALMDALGPEMVPFIQFVYRDPLSGLSKIKLLDELQYLPKLMASGTLGDIMSRGELEEINEKEVSNA